MEWIYLASAAQTDLASTLRAVMHHQLLWRPAYNSKNAVVANVGRLQVGDYIVLAWRETRRAYLRCRVAAPLSPVERGGRRLVIDRIEAAKADDLARLGYAANAAGEFEAVRFDEVEECWFALAEPYPGQNALHQLDPRDERAARTAGPIPPGVWEGSDRVMRSVAPARPASAAAAIVGDGVHLSGAAARSFDAYVMVDWSSSSKPTTGNDSIWIASGCWDGDRFAAGEPENLATRHAAVDRITSLARGWKAEGRRVLVGLDFAFGYPAGFADALGLDASAGAWRAVHAFVAREVADDATNRHSRDAFADACNRRIAPNGPGPFWACTAAAVTSHLTQQRQGIFRFPYAERLDEWRVTERRAATRTVTQSVWKLNCGVSVGGQTIVGIKHLHEMRCSLDARCWPFDTGWTTPLAGNGCVWFAEIFPSLVRYPEWSAEYARRRDRTQVLSCVRRAAEDDAGGTLGERFHLPTDLPSDKRAAVEREEGWILWV